MSRLGKPAVDFALPDTTGRVWTMADFAGRWLHLVFLRHLGCPSCRAHLAELRRHESELAALGVDLLVVTFEKLEHAQRYREETQIPWPLVIDAKRELYRAYALKKGSWNELYGPRAIWFYLTLMWRRVKVRWPTADTSQLGGDVLVDPRGIVRYQDVAAPADRPTFETLASVVRDA